jgi:hypothetical protein
VDRKPLMRTVTDHVLAEEYGHAESKRRDGKAPEIKTATAADIRKLKEDEAQAPGSCCAPRRAHVRRQADLVPRSPGQDHMVQGDVGAGQGT